MRKIYPIVFILLALFARIDAQTRNIGSIVEEPKMFSMSGAKFINQSIVEKNDSQMFEIKVQYPELTGVNPAVAEKFNQLTKDVVTKEVEEFRKTVLAQTTLDSETNEKAANHYMEMHYGVNFVSDRLVSVGFASLIDEGAEQLNEYSFTINFDLKSGKKLELSDLFKPNSNYLKFISEYSIRSLKQKLENLSDDEWLENGAGARSENFQSWSVSKKGISIHFDPQKVAPYAAGPREILIPYTELKNILLENGAVSQL